jgi:N6-L-threonylcarbamoyladenine synthase
LKAAAVQTGVSRIAIAGGVSANSGLQERLKSVGANEGWEVFIPEFQYSTDNAGMIAIAAHFKYLRGEFCPLDTVPLARMPL